MSRSTADLAAIKTEFQTNPESLDYLAFDAANDVANAERMNRVRDALQVDRQAIPVQEIVRNIDLDEYAALSAPQREWLALIMSAESVDPSAGNEIREGLLQLFVGGSETRTNLVALLTEPASRVEQMFRLGLLESGGNVTPSDIADARRS